MKVSQLASDPSLIRQLFEGLRVGMVAPTKFKLPYKKAARELQLKQKLAEYYDIDIDRAKAKVVTGLYEAAAGFSPTPLKRLLLQERTGGENMNLEN